MDYKDKQDFFKIRKTLLEMLVDRKYKVPPELLNITFDEFNVMIENDNIDIYVNDGVRSVYVYININNKKSFGKKELIEQVSRIETEHEDVNNIIIVLNKINNTTFDKEIRTIKYKNVEYFMSNRLKFNITKNNLVPKHILLTEKEKLEIFKKYKANNGTVFQKILLTDPVARYYGMKSGDLCKIIRPTPTSGISIGYRIVK